MSLSRILVFGATGQQGGAVINALLSSPNVSSVEINAVTRHPDSTSAKALASRSPNIKLVKGSFDDIPMTFQNVGGEVDSVFAVTPVNTKKNGKEIEIGQGKVIVDAAIDSGVKHFVFTSVDRHGDMSNSDPTYVPHFASKYEIEQHLKAKAAESGMTWTILRPVAFMDNFDVGFFGKIMGTLLSQLGDTTMQMVSLKDIGIFGAKALLHPDQFKNRSISLAGDELSFADANAVYRKLFGRPLPKTFGLIGSLVGWAVEDMGLMFKWWTEVNFGADIEECRRINPEMQTFETWLKETSRHIP